MQWFKRQTIGVVLVWAIGLLGVMSGPAVPARAGENGSLTGNVGVVSKYIFRGGVESDQATVQGGFDYTHPIGFYAGYWGSQLDYTQPAGRGSDGFENDVYLGFSESTGPVSFDVGVLQYLYSNVDEDPATGKDADATDLYGSVGFGPLSLGVAYAAADASWTNSGDMYWTLHYEKSLPAAFDFRAKVGYYDFDNDDDNLNGTESSNFRDLVLSLSHPIGETGAAMSASFVLGGEDRNGADFDNQFVLGVQYDFAIADF